MLVKCKDEDGKIIAYAEYEIVDSKGHPNQVGRYVFIRDVWIHKDYRDKNLLHYMLYKEINKYITEYGYLPVKWLYYERRDKGKPLKVYDIKKLLRRI